MDKPYLQAIATLVGMIIGAGILGIPFVVAKSGYLFGAINILVVGLAIMVVNLYTGEISLRTKGVHQVTGYAEKYLGKWGKVLMLISMLVVGLSALTAYLMGIAKSLVAMFGFKEWFFIFMVFVILGYLLHRGLGIIKKWELILAAGILVVIIIIALLSLPKVRPINLSDINLPFLLFPYGVVFFSFMGYQAIPELKEILGARRKEIRGAIVVGSIIPIIIYLLFTAIVVAVTGATTTDVATIGLGKDIGEYMVILGNLLAIFTMSTSFLAVGLAVKWVFQYDYRMRKSFSWALTVFPPLAIALAGITNFIQAIDLGGAFGGGIGGILLVLIFHRAKKLGERNPEFTVNGSWLLSVLLMILFIGGMAYTLFSLFSPGL